MRLRPARPCSLYRGLVPWLYHYLEGRLAVYRRCFFFLTFNSKVIPTHIIDPEMDTKTNSRESLETRIANLRPHRCHPRAADVVHTLLSLQLTSFPARAYLLASCLSSTPGSEPTDPYLIDPASHVIRLKKSAAIISTEAKEATRS